LQHIRVATPRDFCTSFRAAHNRQIARVLRNRMRSA
jgi:hypothetical protein